MANSSLRSHSGALFLLKFLSLQTDEVLVYLGVPDRTLILKFVALELSLTILPYPSLSVAPILYDKSQMTVNIVKNCFILFPQECMSHEHRYHQLCKVQINMKLKVALMVDRPPDVYAPPPTVEEAGQFNVPSPV